MHGSERGVKLFYMAEYCDTLQSKEKRNWEHKACLNDRALRLLDQDVPLSLWLFSAPEKIPFYSSISSVCGSFTRYSSAFSGSH
jgi:hypothetical protein